MLLIKPKLLNKCFHSQVDTIDSSRLNVLQGTDNIVAQNAHEQRIDLLDASIVVDCINVARFGKTKQVNVLKTLLNSFHFVFRLRLLLQLLLIFPTAFTRSFPIICVSVIIREIPNQKLQLLKGV